MLRLYPRCLTMLLFVGQTFALIVFLSGYSMAIAHENLGGNQTDIDSLFENMKNIRSDDNDVDNRKLISLTKQLLKVIETTFANSPQQLVFASKKIIDILDYDEKSIKNISDEMFSLYIDNSNMLVNADVWNPYGNDSIDACKEQINTLIWKNRIISIRSKSGTAYVINRRVDVDRILCLWSKILNRISDDPKFVSYNFDDEFNVVDGYKIPWEHFGAFRLSGETLPHSQLIKDENIRVKYEFFLKRRDEFLAKRNDHSKATLVKESYSSRITRFIVTLYKNTPNNDELITLVEKHNISENEKYAIFKALNIAYKGFRDWQTKDNLFNATAKFISLSKGSVTIEKEDGKRATIELSALRKEDQDYVKEQLAPKPEKPKTDSSP